MFKVDNEETRMKSSTSFWCLDCELWVYFILFGPPAVVWRVLWIRVRPSVFPSFRRKFSWDWLIIFSETQHSVRGPCLVVRDRAGFFLKNLFAPKMGKMGQKQVFLNLLENLVINFFWIWSIKKFYNICCVLAQILYLGKIWFLRDGPKCSQPIRLQYF